MAMTKEQKKEKARQRRQQQNELTYEYKKAHSELFPYGIGKKPSLTYTYEGIRNNSLAHRLLQDLEDHGGQTLRNLGGGTSFGQANVSAQILRLLDKQLIDHHANLYSIRTGGERVLARLNGQILSAQLHIKEPRVENFGSAGMMIRDLEEERRMRKWRTKQLKRY